MTDAPRPLVSYGPTVVLGLLGAVAVTVGVTKPWATATGHQTGLPAIESHVSGADLAPLAGALGVVVLAAFGAVIATRGWVRRGLGLLIVVAAAVVVVSAIAPPGATTALQEGLAAKGWSSGSYETGVAAWRWVALTGAIVCVAAGFAIFVYGARWATMGREYDAPASPTQPAESEPTAQSAASGSGQEPLNEVDLWREIDQGRDPTHHDGA